MKKYVFFRILRSIVSIFLVTTITFVIIYSLVPRKNVFRQDPMSQRLASSPDKLTAYENTGYAKMNYIDYKNTSELVSATNSKYKSADVSGTNAAHNVKYFKKWAQANNFELKRFKISRQYYAVRELPLMERLGRFYGKLIQVDGPWRIHDKHNPHLARYLKIQKDPAVGWAVVGSGTKYRYQIYFNKSFPWIHQNIIKFDLGTSYPTFGKEPVSEVIGARQGEAATRTIKTKSGQTLNTSDNIYTRSYQPKNRQDPMARERYHDDYVNVDQDSTDPSMIGTSFKAGIIALIIAYAIAIPVAITMARHKGGWFDRIWTGVVTVLTALPTLAIIYTFRAAGAAATGMPDSFPTLGAEAWQSWVLPSVILGLLSVSGLIIWFRRYMVDQQSSDYVKFARAKGLNDGEIYRKHILKNASIPIINGIPASIIGLIGGATMTEEIFAMPGMGKMLPDSIIANNNSVVIALTFIFTTISVLSVLLGDLAMAIVDPRIKLSSGDD